MKKMINRKILILISLLLFLPLLVGCFLFPSANQSPTITSTPITAATVGEEYTYDVEATDPDSGDTLTYSLTTSPTGMNINSITGVINWAPTSAQIGDYNVTVEVSDGSLSDTQSFIIVVSEAPPAPPAPPTPVAVTGVTLNQATMTLTAGGATGTLVATVAPADATNKSVNWSSSAPAVATVASGVVTPLTAGTTTIIVATVDGGKTATCAVTVNPVAVGDSYGGGKVAYILVDGDTGYDANVQHGLIAATADQSDGIAWITGGSTQTTLNGNTSTALGEGQANTNAMKAQDGYTGGAAQVCDDYSVTVGSVTYDDWFLPSKDELNLMYTNLKVAGVGGFADNFYWSSSEYDADCAWLQDINDGGQYSGGYKFVPYRVRAVRAF